MGGTRFIGRECTRLLIERGHAAALFHRGATPCDVQGVKEILGDRLNIQDFRSEFARFEPDVVIDMFAMTEASAKCAIRALDGICSKMVVISSADVYRAYGVLIGAEEGGLEPTPMTESAPLRSRLFPYRDQFGPDDWRHDYDKILVERAYLDAFNAIVLRLPIVYGPNDYQHRTFHYLKRSMDKRKYYVESLEFARWRATRCFSRNAAHAICLAAVSECSSSVFNVGEERAWAMYDWRIWTERFSPRYGSMTPILYYNKDLPPPLQDDGNYLQQLVLDTSKIRREIGYREVVSFHDAMKETVAWQWDNPPEQGGPNAEIYAAEDEMYRRRRQ